MNTCAIDGCDKPYRARGLCSTHYNRAHQPNRHRLVKKPCTVCGTVVMRQASDRYQTVCSTTCRTLLDGGTPGNKAPQWEADAIRRARRAGVAVIEQVKRSDVGERDGWTCQECHEPTDRNADPLSPSAPTIDHIVPLSKGGAHAMWNCQVLCYSCNSRKSDTLPAQVGERVAALR